MKGWTYLKRDEDVLIFNPDGIDCIMIAPEHDLSTEYQIELALRVCHALNSTEKMHRQLEKNHKKREKQRAKLDGLTRHMS